MTLKNCECVLITDILAGIWGRLALFFNNAEPALKTILARLYFAYSQLFLSFYGINGLSMNWNADNTCVLKVEHTGVDLKGGKSIDKYVFLYIPVSR